MRARRTVRNRYRTRGARAAINRYHLRSNPNMGNVLEWLKGGAGVAGGLYGSRFVASTLKGILPASITGFIPASFQGVAMSSLSAGLLHFITNMGPIKKVRGPVMLGSAIEVVSQLLSAIAPASVKAMFGLSDYVSIGDYVSVGAAPPLRDDITLRDYVAVGAVQEELGVEEELGLDQELGDDTVATDTTGSMTPQYAAATSVAPMAAQCLPPAAQGGPLSRAYLGGVSGGSMLAPVQAMPMSAVVPAASFTKVVPSAGRHYDNSDSVYAGIFSGGW